ncbi:MAG: hypothetical protein AAFW69_05780 [Pseudomonadota bacterium]
MSATDPEPQIDEALKARQFLDLWEAALSRAAAAAPLPAALPPNRPARDG